MPHADDLEEYVSSRDKKKAGFATLVDAAEMRQEWGRQMAKKRQAKNLSQTTVAARMRTSSSVVSRIESGADVKVSSLQKYVDAVGTSFAFSFSRSRRQVGSKRKPAKTAQK